jgi:hypothetical protein
LHFQPTASDYLLCPHCGELGTTTHFLTDCHALHHHQWQILKELPMRAIFRIMMGACCLISFLHTTQLMLCPLQGCPPVPQDNLEPPDPPWVLTLVLTANHDQPLL